MKKTYFPPNSFQYVLGCYLLKVDASIHFTVTQQLVTPQSTSQLHSNLWRLNPLHSYTATYDGSAARPLQVRHGITPRFAVSRAASPTFRQAFWPQSKNTTDIPSVGKKKNNALCEKKRKKAVLVHFLFYSYGGQRSGQKNRSLY